MDRITIASPPVVSTKILETIAKHLQMSKPKAKTWLKRHVFDVVKSNFMYVNGVPHTYRNSDHRFVTATLLSAGVSEEEAEKVFHANFNYSEPISSSGDIVFAETVMEFSERLAKRTLKDSPELAKILNK